MLRGITILISLKLSYSEIPPHMLHIFQRDYGANPKVLSFDLFVKETITSIHVLINAVYYHIHKRTGSIVVNL